MKQMVHLLVDSRPYYEGERPTEPWWGLMACGMRQLATGHAYINDTAAACLHVTCPTCLPECQQLGTPISQLSGHPGAGEPYDRFVAIGESWGYP